MLKKLTVGLLALGVFFSSYVSATQTYMLSSGLNISYELEPKEPIELYNFAFWTLTAVCSIKTPDEFDTIEATLLSQKAVLNGKNLAKGDTFKIDVHNGDTLHITAVPQAKVRLVNLGKHTIMANCSA